MNRSYACVCRGGAAAFFTRTQLSFFGNINSLFTYYVAHIVVRFAQAGAAVKVHTRPASTETARSPDLCEQPEPKTCDIS